MESQLGERPQSLGFELEKEVDWSQAADFKAPFLRKLVDFAKSNKAQSLSARLGRMHFGDTVVPTPAFMPVGTQASVKSLISQDLSSIGYNLILSNTYHLALRPTAEVLRDFGGLHRFMQWPGAILTDSGGFQVMSLAERRKITETGVSFSSHIDGKKLDMTPESVVDLQDDFGSNIQMVLDECTPHPATFEQAKSSMERSMRWAKRARERFEERAQSRVFRHYGPTGVRSQFGIVQGGMYPELRQLSAKEIADFGFEGHAIGGLSVGETKSEMREMLLVSEMHLPKQKPRYLMGVGAPDDLIDAVLLGVDMFDCVMPTRNARNGSIFVRSHESASGKIQIKNARHRLEDKPLDSKCGCLTCQNYSRAYLRHLFMARELSVHRLLTIHNLNFLFDLMESMRLWLANPAVDLERLVEIRREFTGSEDFT